MTSQIGRIQRMGAFAIFLVATVIIILGAYAAFRHYASDLVAREEQDLLAIAELKKSLIEQHVRERIADAEVFAARRPVMAALNHNAPAPLKAESIWQLPAAIDLTVRAYGYRHIVILDPTAKPVFPANDAAPPSAVLDAIAASRRSMKPAFVDLHRSDIGEMVYGVAAPVLDAQVDAGVHGFVYLQAVANSKLYPVALDWPTPSATGESILIRREGDEVVYLSLLRHRRDLQPLDTKLPVANTNLLAAKAVSGHTGIIHDIVDYRGVPVIGTARPVEGTPWILLTKMDLTEARSDLEDLTHAIIVLAAIFIVIAAGVSLLIWRTSRLEAAQEQAELARQYQTAIETTTDAYVRLDATGRIVETNQALADMTGYTRDELLALGLPEVEGTKTPEEIQVSLKAIREAGNARFQTRWRRKDGTLVDLDVSTVYVNSPSGGSYYGYMRDITESLGITRRLKRLNLFYMFLTHVTEEIGNLRVPEDILAAVCRIAVRDRAFELAWAGIVDHEKGSLRVIAAEGAAADYARQINITLDPALPTSRGPTGYAINERRTVEVNDFLNDPRTEPWQQRAREFNLRASASTPVIVDDKVVAVLNVYAGELGYFDREFIGLLEETAHNVALSWEAGTLTRERDAERSQREKVEARFARIFDSSPIAKQIHSRTTSALVSINRSHQELFGYPLHEISGDRWGETAYPDQALRQRVYEQWHKDIETSANSGRMMESPELELRCRDGSTRRVRGYMSVEGNDVIIAWIDLTAIRKTEAAVEESESRFRGMVEQTITGFYVVHGNQLLYVNPAFAQMVGWSREELIGKNPLDFLDDESRAIAMAGVERMAAGAKTIGYTVRVRRKDGTYVVLGINGTKASWDDKPALVAMAEDITERTRADEKVRESLHRLERSMTGTLNAVARMVDLRDPYTAGHQRRVGLISADIARELGWTEGRCHTMEMIGLVHDIGKIAVPAEILSKPTRLTPLEYDMIKAHAQASRDILRDVEFDIPVGEIIGQHHERLDGSGYPKGLKGDEILPEARVLAVADVLESMASHRPYRAALGTEAALEELTSKKGTHFDTAIVDAVVHMVREKNYQLPK